MDKVADGVDGANAVAAALSRKPLVESTAHIASI